MQHHDSLTTAQHAQHEPDVKLLEHSSRSHAHTASVHSPDSQHAQQAQQQQHLYYAPVAPQRAQHADPTILQLEDSSNQPGSEGIYSPNAQRAQQPQQQQQEEMVWQQRQVLTESPESELAHSQAAAARPARAPLSGPERPQEGLGLEGRGAQEESGAKGRQGAQQGSGLEGWQTQMSLGEQETHRGSGLEGTDTQGGSGLEGRLGRTKGGSDPLQYKRQQLAPVLPMQQESDMYHVQPLHASAHTAQAGEMCHASKVCLLMALLLTSMIKVSWFSIAQPSRAPFILCPSVNCMIDQPGHRSIGESVSQSESVSRFVSCLMSQTVG